ncbi:hypothetical protein PUN28_004121 [Cardiocondyla obscurior]|uniref:Uncharacterized protein n=1 Tax=Cardiocondyla obscurior TaxID=286306 RepID=A0AAW2GPN3_9HYME
MMPDAPATEQLKKVRRRAGNLLYAYSHALARHIQLKFSLKNNKVDIKSNKELNTRREARRARGQISIAEKRYDTARYYLGKFSSKLMPDLG